MKVKKHRNIKQKPKDVKNGIFKNTTEQNARPFQSPAKH